MWTEFVSCEALCSSSPASRDRMMTALAYAPEERPIVAQLFGSKPHQFRESALLLRDLGFDGIDINMGCPEKNVNKQGSGAALILDPLNAKAIIRACQESGLPVSVKTRIGFHEIEYHDWIHHILDTEPEALTIHGRTRDEMSAVPAHWDAIGDILHLVKAKRQSSCVVIGNGDIESIPHAQEMVDTYGVDGVMIGRALFGNPWMFQGHSNTAMSVEAKCHGLLRHVHHFDRLLGSKANFHHVKKMFGSYLAGIPHAKVLKEALAATTSPDQVYPLVEEFVANSKEAKNYRRTRFE
ncbi:hypothetical protein, variant 1 [Aphanomyces invadans]|nr:hypothetical protein, variant 1 [Aphanomyces invadans]ETW01124.1 hypothetical protein, variant 1 [Aphanomyces invadans]|eukprot:XP_008870122.1 hypothetical protein, variant 1 [Aphanomyces invadans]